MSSFILSNKDLEIENLNFLSVKRGPDCTNFCSISGFNIIHNLLDISKNGILHPLNADNITLLFDGEIYGDITLSSIIPLYKEYGKTFVEHINGEYAMVIVDENNGVIYMYSDVFSTKPLFYSIEDRNIGIASYASELKLLGFDNIIRVSPSSYIELNINNYSIQEHKHNKFNFDEYKTSYNDCIAALENAIKIRCNQRCAIPLSSGYDSGAILQWSLLNNIGENSFYHLTNNREDPIVMNERFEKCKNHNFQYKIIDYYKNKSINDLIEFKKISNTMEDFEVYKDYDTVCMLSKLVSIIKKDGYNAIVSGDGAEAIVSNDRKDGSYFYNLEKLPLAFDIYLQEIINEFEYIAGIYGVQVRYPLLDKFFVQEFLNLSPKLKTQKYKSVISEYLHINNLSTQQIKTGMSCSNATHESIKTNFIL